MMVRRRIEELVAEEEEDWEKLLQHPVKYSEAEELVLRRAYSIPCVVLGVVFYAALTALAFIHELYPSIKKLVDSESVDKLRFGFFAVFFVCSALTVFVYIFSLIHYASVLGRYQSDRRVALGIDDEDGDEEEGNTPRHAQAKA